jgi:DNA polymerase-1
LNGDRDSLQLVSDKTSVHLCTNRTIFSTLPKKIMEDYGVTPPELIEIKAIQGDSSDNIPELQESDRRAQATLLKSITQLNIYTTILTSLKLRTEFATS